VIAISPYNRGKVCARRIILFASISCELMKSACTHYICQKRHHLIHISKKNLIFEYGNLSNHQMAKARPNLARFMAI
jgi:hypothetical protein